VAPAEEGCAADRSDPMGDKPGAHDPYAALRFRDYRRLLTGNVLSSLGFEMQNTAIGWELYQRTNSAAALGYVGLVQFLPVLALALPAGHAADRYSRKGIFLLAQSLMATASAGLAVLSLLQGPVSLVYLCLLYIGIARAFSAPARWALVPAVVPTDALGNAITWNSSGWQVAATLGPALGGGIIAVTGRAAGAYVFAASLAVTCAGLVATIRPRPVARPAEPLSLDSFMAGARFVWTTPLILATITLDLFAVLLGGAVALLPIYARDILQIGPTGLGWLRAAPSIGALLMALAMAHRPPLRRAGRSLLIAVAGFGVATIVFGLSRDPALSFVMLMLTGALDNISIVVRGTLVQLLTPDAMRGRVSAVNTIFIVSSNELGAFESGMTADWFGPVASVVGGGIGSILVVLAVMLRWPQVLRIGPLNNPTGSLYTEVAEAEIIEKHSG
jgi:MFS family permease